MSMERFMGRKVKVALKEQLSIYGVLVEYNSENIILKDWHVEADDQGLRSVLALPKKGYEEMRHGWGSDGDPRDVTLIPRSNILFMGFMGPSYK